MPANSEKSHVTRLPEGSPLEYAPTNEQGVVYLFSQLAKSRYGIRVESVQTGFPDCTAVRAGKRVSIEFEYRSKNFRTHGHKSEGCQIIVCWIHDWPACPPGIEVIELRRQYGLGFNVWMQAVAGEYSELLSTTAEETDWSVASEASPGDLIVFYHSSPRKYAGDIFVITEDVKHTTAAGWKKGTGLKSEGDYWSYIKPVAHLKCPIHLSEFREHPVMSTCGYVRRSMIGRFRMTPFWPSLHRMILDRNPGLKKSLSKFGMDRLT